jgi:hypothetical protein
MKQQAAVYAFACLPLCACAPPSYHYETGSFMPTPNGSPPASPILPGLTAAPQQMDLKTKCATQNLIPDEKWNDCKFAETTAADPEGKDPTLCDRVQLTRRQCAIVMNSAADLEKSCRSKGHLANHVAGECFLSLYDAGQRRQQVCPETVDCTEAARSLARDAAGCDELRIDAYSIMSEKRSGLSAEAIYEGARQAQIQALADEVPRPHASAQETADLIRIAEEQTNEVGPDGFAEKVFVSCLKHTGLYIVADAGLVPR